MESIVANQIIQDGRVIQDPVFLKDGTIREGLFGGDNFSSRRTTGHNLYDPESLLTGDEMLRGLDYGDVRVWPAYEYYLLAATQELGSDGKVVIPVDTIPVIAPRRKGWKEALRQKDEPWTWELDGREKEAA